jgi:hypothetical protein
MLNTCSSIAARLDSNTTKSSEWPKTEPASMSVAQLPGSM